jgi:Uncharacterized protein conserved in bacteria (DUF2188)
MLVLARPHLCDSRKVAMAKADIETYYDDGQWKSRREGSQRAFAVGGNKAEQTSHGREAALRDDVEHMIKKMDGSIGEKNSYGDDPYPPKG